MTSWRTNKRTKKRYPRITGIGGKRQDEFLSARDKFAEEFKKAQDAFATAHVSARNRRSEELGVAPFGRRAAIRRKHHRVRLAAERKHRRRVAKSQKRHSQPKGLLD